MTRLLHQFGEKQTMSFQAGGDEAQAVLAKVAFITQRTNATAFDDLIVLNRSLKVQICGP